MYIICFKIHCLQRDFMSNLIDIKVDNLDFKYYLFYSQRAGTSRERLSETPLDSTSACEESKQDEMSFVRPSSSSVSLMQLSGLRRPTPNALVCPSHPNNGNLWIFNIL